MPTQGRVVVKSRPNSNGIFCITALLSGEWGLRNQAKDSFPLQTSWFTNRWKVCQLSAKDTYSVTGCSRVPCNVKGDILYVRLTFLGSSNRATYTFPLQKPWFIDLWKVCQFGRWNRSCNGQVRLGRFRWRYGVRKEPGRMSAFLSPLSKTGSQSYLTETDETIRFPACLGLHTCVHLTLCFSVSKLSRFGKRGELSGFAWFPSTREPTQRRVAVGSRRMSNAIICTAASLPGYPATLPNILFEFKSHDSLTIVKFVNSDDGIGQVKDRQLCKIFFSSLNIMIDWSLKTLSTRTTPSPFQNY